jgi:hypothetical protein
MFTVDESAKHNTGMPHPQAPAIMVNEYHRRQTKPGELLDDLLYKRTIPGIHQALQTVAVFIRINPQTCTDGFSMRFEMDHSMGLDHSMVDYVIFKYIIPIIISL